MNGNESPKGIHYVDAGEKSGGAAPAAVDKVAGEEEAAREAALAAQRAIPLHDAGPAVEEFARTVEELFPKKNGTGQN